MKTIHKKEVIIEKAAELFHHLGYHHTGINQILTELKIPKGSFYNYFESKEALAVTVIDWHIAQTKEIFETSTKDNKNSLGLQKFFGVFFNKIEAMNYLNGCPVGNLITELADLNEPVRLKLLQWVEYLETEVYNIILAEKQCLEADARSLASFVIASFEGVIMKSKVEQNSNALNHFNQYIIKNLLNS